MALETRKEGDIITELASSVRLPKTIKVKQLLGRSHIDVNEIPGIVRSGLDREELRTRIKPGASVVITCGSRGAANIAVIIRAIVDSVRKCDGSPFVLPAVGSHGGATAREQRGTLASYHVTEDAMGYSIRATMEVVQVDETPDGIPVYVDRCAYEADTIIPCGRVEAHTTFRGPYESGIMKVAVIGLGKQKGVKTVRRNGFCKLGTMFPVVRRVVLEYVPVIGALALVGNAFDRICIIRGILGEEIYEKEPKLLITSKRRLERIYFDNIGVLVVDRIGKDISGDGVGPDITGRSAIPYISEGIKARHITVLDLADETHGNCGGLELADVITKRLVDKVDVNYTYPSVVTSTVLCTPRIPLFTHSDKTCIQIALHTCNCIGHKHPRVMRIKNMMNLEEIYISESMLKEAEESNHVIVSGPPKDWVFNEEGNPW